MNLFRCLAVALVFLSAGCSYKALEFEYENGIQVIEETKYILLSPQNENPETCFLFYPGGLVQEDAYIDVFQDVAKNNYQVIILKATADLAILNTNRAQKVKEKFPEIKNWIIGGHSLGGTVAIKAILDKPDEYKGLILFASYNASGDDLSDWNGAVMSISAENDSIATFGEIAESKELLPEAIELNSIEDFPNIPTLGKSLFFQIEGGNHSQFGSYGFQKNDGIATISPEKQHQIMTDLISLFFKANNWN